MSAPVASAGKVGTHFSCHLCGESAYRVLLSKAVGPHQEDPSISSAAAYACTNRLPVTALQVVECRSCRLRALHPAPPAADVERAYAAVEDPEYLQIEPYREIAFQKLLAHIRTFRRSSGRLLDVGCYTGLFPRAAQEAGWDAYGIEPSAWAAQVASDRLPGRITAGFLRDAHFAPESFDVITSWDVIEHVTDPKDELRRMAKLLKPGGWLFLSTMRADAPIVRLLGRRWPWYMEMHRFYFTADTLGALLRSAGLEPGACAPYPHYTSLKYIFWKLEPTFGFLARFGTKLARALRLDERPIRVDLGDFLLTVAERRE